MDKPSNVAVLLTDALTDVVAISRALIDIVDWECCNYHHEAEVELAEKWVKLFDEEETE